MIFNGRIIEKDIGGDGGLVYKVVTPSGQLIEGVMTLGEGGDMTIFHHTPYNVGSEVMVVCGNDTGRPPYFIIGGVTSPVDRVKIGAVDVPFTQATDYKTISPSDMAFRNKNTGLVLAQEGVAISSKGVNLQLRGNKLRVSQGGVADNEILNADPTISTLIPYFERVNQTLQALCRAVEIIAPDKLTELGEELTTAIALASQDPTAINQARVVELEGKIETLTSALGVISTSPSIPTSGMIEADLEASKNSSILVP